MYGVDVSPMLISNVTQAVMEEVKTGRNLATSSCVGANSSTLNEAEPTIFRASPPDYAARSYR